MKITSSQRTNNNATMETTSYRQLVGFFVKDFRCCVSTSLLLLNLSHMFTASYFTFMSPTRTVTTVSYLDVF